MSGSVPTKSGPRMAEVKALRRWRRRNGLPEIADPPTHWSDVSPTPRSRLRTGDVAATLLPVLDWLFCAVSGRKATGRYDRGPR